MMSDLSATNTHFTAAKHEDLMGMLQPSAMSHTRHAHHLINSLPDKVFDRVTRFVARLLGVPTVLIMLSTSDQQFILSSFGLPGEWIELRQPSLPLVVCQHVVNDHAPLMLSDIRLHPFFHERSIFSDVQGIAYASVPILSPDGEVMGALCAIDYVPRYWSDTALPVLQDIAEMFTEELRRRQATRAHAVFEQQLFESQTYINSILAATPDAVLILDERQQIIRCNHAAELLLGYAAPSLLHQPIARVLPFETCGLYQRLMLEPGEASGDQLLVHALGPCEAIRADATRVPVEGSAIKMVMYAAPQYMLVLHDLSQRRALEAQVLHAQKLATIGQLTSAIVHDFNNLLMAIEGCIGLAGRMLPDAHPARNELHEARLGIQRSTRLTDQLLAFSHKHINQPQLLDLNQFIQEIATLLQRLIGSEIVFTIELEAQIDRILISPGHLEQVLVNLIVNARDAMPHGGMLSLMSTTKLVDEQMTQRYMIQPGRYVVLSVQDTGGGILPEVASQLFEPFVTTKAPEQGTGLGLATCAMLVDHYRGAIKVESVPGQGATFMVYLPATTQPDPATD